MGAVQNFNEPDFTSAMDASIDSIRDNYHFLMCVAATGSIVLPGWQTTVTATDYSEPDTITLTRGTKRIIINYTWNADGSVNTIQLCYDDGVSSPGLTCFNGTKIQYDSGGNVTGGVEDTMARSLSEWFAFEESSGTTRTGSHAGIVLQQSYAPGALSAVGIVGNAVDFERSLGGEYKSTATESTMDGSTDFTVSFWIRVESHYTNGYICSHGPTSEDANDHNWYFDVNSGGIIFAIGKSGIWYTATHSATISTGTWYHVVGTYDHATQTMSIIVNDGTATQTNSVPAPNSTASSYLWMCSRGTTSGIDGRVDEWGYWQRVLSSDEITQLYNSGAGITYTDL